MVVPPPLNSFSSPVGTSDSQPGRPLEVRRLRLAGRWILACLLLCLISCRRSDPAPPADGRYSAPEGESAAEDAQQGEINDAQADRAVEETENSSQPRSPEQTTTSFAGAASSDDPWQPLFDGKSLDGWKLSSFLGQGEVTVDRGTLVLGRGNDMTGVKTDRPLPKIDYEVALQAMRVEGFDFFCGLTFQVYDDPCSLIVGGWGGGVCGLSSIDGLDASENETLKYRDFDDNRWYAIRLRVTREKIEAWIDEEQIVDLPIAGREISIRGEIEPSRPFGFATWQTTAALRNIRIRELAPDKRPEPPSASP